VDLSLHKLAMLLRNYLKKMALVRIANAIQLLLMNAKDIGKGSNRYAQVQFTATQTQTLRF
jgi:hypothetical protein